MSDIDFSREAKVFKAFSDPNRLHILHALKKGDICGCNLLKELNISQPTLSHHMKILCEARIVKGRKQGKWVYYSYDRTGVKLCQDSLNEFTSIMDEFEAQSRD